MSKHKVLIIEDDNICMELISRYVQKLDFEVIIARDGKSGLELFQKTLPDIVITDLSLPVMHGNEVIKNIKRISNDVPIIIVTGFSESDTVIAAIKEGVLDYIKKPIDFGLINMAIGRAKEKLAISKKLVPYPSILIAEDEEVVRNRLVKVLKKEGFLVFSACDGAEALDIFKEKKIDLVLSDIKMPKMDGLQALHEMRKITDDFEAMILSGYGDEDSAIKALREGAINFIKKPINLEELILAVQKAIEKLQITRSLKYRTRELELTKEIVAAITFDKEIVIDFNEYINEPAYQFVRQLLNCFQVGLIIFTKDLKIKYVNDYLSRALENKTDKIDDELLKRLEKVGIREISVDILSQIAARVIDSSIGTLETVKTGRYSTITLTPIKVLDKENKRLKEKAVLMIVRGERP